MRPRIGRAPSCAARGAAQGRGSRATAVRALLPIAALVVGLVLAVPARPAHAAGALSRLSLEQQVGQVFMVGTPATGVAAATVAAIRDRHVGNVILTGRSSAGVSATASITRALQAQATSAATGRVGLLIATDQEGGWVQVLQGPGFSTIPTALSQGGLAPATLRSDAAIWGRQLSAAGVNVDLAPVLDTVPSAAAAPGNPPIGAYDREYGYTPATVASHGTAFAQGMADVGVAATAKHFPGLGRVPGNTDTQAGVTDTVTTRHDAYLTPFAQAVQDGVPLLMVSTAYYTQIDPAHPAAFSSTVIQGMVRGDLGFNGVVVSDDLGAARQVAAWSPGSRALQFLQAGGDLVLTVDPAQLPAMYDAVLAQARSDAGFRARVQQAASRVLALKQQHGLVPAAGDVDVVQTQNTGSGRTELHTLSRADNFQAFSAHVATALGEVDLSTGQFALADYDGDGVPDLWYIKTQGASGHTELHILSGASGYQTWLLHAVTALPPVSRSTWTFGAADQNGDGRADLWAVNTADAGSHGTAVFAWNGHDLNQMLLARALPLGPVSLTTNQFLFGDENGDGRPDVWDVRTQGTQSGRTDFHVVDGTDPSRWLLHVASPLQPVSLAQFAFGLADFNQDGHTDVYAMDSDDAHSGRTAVHVIAGPTYGVWIAHVATALAPQDLATTALLPD